MDSIYFIAYLFFWFMCLECLVACSFIWPSLKKIEDIPLFTGIFLGAIGIFIAVSLGLPTVEEVALICGYKFALSFHPVSRISFIFVASGSFCAAVLVTIKAYIRSKSESTTGSEPPPNNGKKLFEQAEKTSEKRKTKITITKTTTEKIEIEKEIGACIEAYVRAKPLRLNTTKPLINNKECLKLLSHKTAIIVISDSYNGNFYKVIEKHSRYERMHPFTIPNHRHNEMDKNISDLFLAKLKKQMQQLELLDKYEITFIKRSSYLNNKREMNRLFGDDRFETIMGWLYGLSWREVKCPKCSFNNWIRKRGIFRWERPGSKCTFSRALWINECILYDLIRMNSRKVCRRARNYKSLRYQPNASHAVEPADNSVKNLLGTGTTLHEVANDMIPNNTEFKLGQTRLTNYCTPVVESPVATKISLFELGQTRLMSNGTPVAQSPDGTRIAPDALLLNLCLTTALSMIMKKRQRSRSNLEETYIHA
jgi:hypothetical protein